MGIITEIKRKHAKKVVIGGELEGGHLSSAGVGVLSSKLPVVFGCRWCGERQERGPLAFGVGQKDQPIRAQAPSLYSVQFSLLAFARRNVHLTPAFVALINPSPANPVTLSPQQQLAPLSPYLSLNPSAGSISTPLLP